MDSVLSEEERDVRDHVREVVDREIIPMMLDYWDRAEFPFEFLPVLGELSIMGGALHYHLRWLPRAGTWYSGHQH